MKKIFIAGNLRRKKALLVIFPGFVSASFLAKTGSITNLPDDPDAIYIGTVQYICFVAAIIRQPAYPKDLRNTQHWKPAGKL